MMPEIYIEYKQIYIDIKEGIVLPEEQKTGLFSIPIDEDICILHSHRA